MKQKLWRHWRKKLLLKLIREIQRPLRTLAGTAAEAYDQNAVSGTATFVGDEHAALSVMINKVANNIAARTRRGAGNYAVVSPFALTIKSLHLKVFQEQLKEPKPHQH